jgi:hypothetical protein
VPLSESTSHYTYPFDSHTRGLTDAGSRWKVAQFFDKSQIFDTKMVEDMRMRKQVRTESTPLAATIVSPPPLDNHESDYNFIGHVFSSRQYLKVSLIPTTCSPHVIPLMKFGDNFFPFIDGYQLEEF